MAFAAAEHGHCDKSLRVAVVLSGLGAGGAGQDQERDLAKNCSVPGELDRFELEFSAVFSLAGRSGRR